MCLPSRSCLLLGAVLALVLFSSTQSAALQPIAQASAEAIVPVEVPDWRIVGQIGGFFAGGIAKAGNYAYVVAGDGGLRVIDIADPSQPVEIGFCDTPGSAISVVLAGDYAYIADGPGGLRVISVANPRHPIEVGFLDPDDFLTANDVAVTSNYVLVAGGGHYDGTERNGLLVVDVTNPANPVEARFFATSYPATAVAASGSYAYLVAEYTLLVVDLGDPTEKTLSPGLGETYSHVTDVFVSGKYLYVTGMNVFPGGGLTVMSIDDGAHPAPVGAYVMDCLPISCGLSTVAISGTSAYGVWNGDLLQISLDDPTYPQAIGWWPIPGSVEELVVTDENIYIANQDGGLIVMGQISGYATFLPVVLSRYPHAAPLTVIGQTGGSARVVAMESETTAARVAFVGIGLRLVVVDVANPAAPAVKGRSGPLPYVIEDIHVSGGMVYVADGKGGLWLVDVSNPFRPTAISSYDSPAYKVDSADGYVYLATSDGLRIVDVSDPLHPTGCGFYNTTGEAVDVAVAGNYAYVVVARLDGAARIPLDSGLLVIDISDPFHPVQAGILRASDGFSEVELSGQLAFVTEPSVVWHRCTGTLRTIDITDPTTPRPVGEVAFFNGYQCIEDSGLEISGIYAYLAYTNFGWDEGGLDVISIADPANLVQVAHHPTIGYAFDVAILGGHAYVAEDGSGLRVIDIANPANPFEVGFYDPPGAVDLVADATSRLACIIEYVWNPYQDVLWTIDVTDRTNPREVGFLAFPDNVWDLTVSGGYAYLASDPNTLQVVSLANPAHPVEVGRYDSPGNPWGVAVSGQYAYVAALEGGLRVVSVSDPAHPREVGFYDTPGWAVDVALAGRYAYVADGSRGLRVVDIANPAHPQEVGFYEPAQEARAVAVVGNYAYVAQRCSSLEYGRCGMSILNIADPTHPVEVGFFATLTPTEGLAVSGNHVYLTESLHYGGATERGGLWVISVANPAHPTGIDYYEAPEPVADVAVSGGHIYIAGDGAGFLVLRDEGQ